MKDYFIAYKKLTPDEEREKREWARQNYNPGEDIKGTWHPVIQEECVKMNFELTDKGLTPEQQDALREL